MSKPILCLDFDGVLNSYDSGWQGIDKIPDEPVPGAQQFIADAIQYFEVWIVSSRTAEQRGRDAIQAWLIGWHFPAGITISASKPGAFVSLDDRALMFNGTFPDMDTLRSFKAWWEK